MVSVRSSGQLSFQFIVSKQCCFYTSLICSVFSAIENVKDGVKFEFGKSGWLFNLQRFKAKTKTTAQTVLHLISSDDCALATHMLEDMELIFNKYSLASKSFCLMLTIKEDLTPQLLCDYPPAVAPTVYLE